MNGGNKKDKQSGTIFKCDATNPAFACEDQVPFDETGKLQNGYILKVIWKLIYKQSNYFLSIFTCHAIFLLATSNLESKSNEWLGVSLKRGGKSDSIVVSLVKFVFSKIHASLRMLYSLNNFYVILLLNFNTLH